LLKATLEANLKYNKAFESRWFWKPFIGANIKIICLLIILFI